MGWSSILKPLLKGGSKISFKLVETLGKGFKGLSTWLSSTKLYSWVKVGTAGGIGVIIYSGWRSAIGSISDATGLSEDHVQTIVFLVLGVMVVYVAVKMLLPGNGETVVNNYIPGESRSSVSSSSKGRSSGTGSRKGVSKKGSSSKGSGRGGRSS